MKKISITSSCYNEELNLDELYSRVKQVMDKYEGKYEWEYILLDNGSTDGTESKLRELASKDKRIKVILNSRNFGAIRSPFYGIIQSFGDAVIHIVSDLQEPPELIEKLIEKWEEGYKIVATQKNKSEESPIFFFIRKMFYKLINKINDTGSELIENFTGFGLYDKQVVDVMRTCDDTYPYLRGLICDIGFEKAIVQYTQPTRKRGITSHNFYSLYDFAMVGITKYSKFPLRFFTFIGFVMSGVSLCISIFYLILKLVFWYSFATGTAPILIAIFFFGSVQLFALGLIGEYIGAIYRRVDKKPLVIEKERINF